MQTFPVAVCFLRKTGDLLVSFFTPRYGTTLRGARRSWHAHFGPTSRFSLLLSSPPFLPSSHRLLSRITRSDTRHQTRPGRPASAPGPGPWNHGGSTWALRRFPDDKLTTKCPFLRSIFLGAAASCLSSLTPSLGVYCCQVLSRGRR